MKLFAKLVAILTIISVIAEIIVNAIPRAQGAWKTYKDAYPEESENNENKNGVDKDGFTQYTEVKEVKNDDL